MVSAGAWWESHYTLNLKYGLKTPSHTGTQSSIFRTSSLNKRKCQLTPVWKWVIALTVPGHFSALSLKLHATRHPLFITTLNIHTPGPQLQHSTTARQSILNLTPGSSWAQCQLYSSIRFIPRGILFMKLQGWMGWVAGDPRTRWQIPPQPLLRSWIRLREVVGLDASYTTV